MKIYVLTALNKGKITVLTATTDKNLMDAITAKLDDECCYAVTECESDNAELFTKTIWKVNFDKDNEIADVYNASDTAGYYACVDKVEFDPYPNTRATIVVVADDVLSAIERAKDLYARALPEEWRA